MGTFYNPKIITDGLVLNLDAGNKKSYPGSGSNWYDLSVKKAIGITTGTLTYGQNYATFNDTQYIATNLNASNLGIYDSSYSCEAVLSFANTSGDNMIFGNNQSSSRSGLHLGIRGAAFYFGHYGSDTSSGTATANKIYHITWTFEKGVSVNYAKIWINGYAINGTGANIGTYIGSTPILIGTGYNVTTSRFAGNFYFGRIYNRLLSANEILQNFNATKSRYDL